MDRRRRWPTRTEIGNNPAVARPLDGRVAIVTGVSRRNGIGFAIARRLLADGARVLVQSWVADDVRRGMADPAAPGPALDALGGEGAALAHLAIDLADADAPGRLVDAALTAFGHVDILVVNHVRSSEQSLDTLTAEELDLSWAVNGRAALLLVQAFARAHDDAQPGRVMLFTSGQHLGPMSHGLPYAVTKGAVHQITLSLSDALADRGITVNAINPGPTDTGWAGGELSEELRRRFPAGRWGTPDDAANLVGWLAGDDGGWINGQVINSEGGFRRWLGAT
jgi:3-oxoacyl-[acyl-carrier protein] reductase